MKGLLLTLQQCLGKDNGLRRGESVSLSWLLPAPVPPAQTEKICSPRRLTTGIIYALNLFYFNFGLQLLQPPSGLVSGLAVSGLEAILCETSECPALRGKGNLIRVCVITL